MVAEDGMAAMAGVIEAKHLEMVMANQRKISKKNIEL